MEASPQPKPRGRLIGRDIGWADLRLNKFLLYGGTLQVSLNTLLFPVRVVKLRLQLQGAEGGGGVRYRSTAHALSSIARTEGVRALFRGLLGFIVGGLPGRLLYFGSVEFWKHRLAQWVAPTTPLQGAAVNGAAGVLSSATAGLWWVPTDVVTQAQQERHSPYRGPVAAVRGIWAAQGIRGFYRGLTATWLMGLPFSATWWSTYELTKQTLRRLLAERPDITESAVLAPVVRDQALESTMHMVGGATAGLTAAIVSNPFDVVRVRMQMQPPPGTQRRYTSVAATLRLLLAEEGPRAFAQGMFARVLIVAPMSAIAFISYELMKKLSLAEPGQSGGGGGGGGSGGGS